MKSNSWLNESSDSFYISNLEEQYTSTKLPNGKHSKLENMKTQSLESLNKTAVGAKGLKCRLKQLFVFIFLLFPIQRGVGQEEAADHIKEAFIRGWVHFHKIKVTVKPKKTIYQLRETKSVINA